MKTIANFILKASRVSLTITIISSIFLCFLLVNGMNDNNADTLFNILLYFLAYWIGIWMVGAFIGSPIRTILYMIGIVAIEFFIEKTGVLSMSNGYYTVTTIDNLQLIYTIAGAFIVIVSGWIDLYRKYLGDV